MSAKKRQTFSKLARERAVQEKRARKQEKKEERKLAAAAAGEADGPVEEASEAAERDEGGE
ncbi:MAG: hypothetical protein ICV67_02025 [Thermoleophilia bacterium]|nr:hypothetical protein [Thermoleophilia bacterium]